MNQKVVATELQTCGCPRFNIFGDPTIVHDEWCKEMVTLRIRGYEFSKGLTTADKFELIFQQLEGYYVHRLERGAAFAREQSGPALIRVTWNQLEELFSLSLKSQATSPRYECRMCGESAEYSTTIKHDLCGNDPCPVGEVARLLWPAIPVGRVSGEAGNEHTDEA